MCVGREMNYRDAVLLAKRLLVDSIWKTANIEVDGITFPDTQEIFDGRAPSDMSVDDIVTVNNIKHAWQFLLDNVDYPLDWQYIREYNRIIGQGIVRNAGGLRDYGVRIGGTSWTPELPTLQNSQDYIRFIMGDSNPIRKALDVFAAITRGQWFSDGNKRTALMATNHVLIHEGVGIFSIQPNDKATFTSLLLSYYESGDATNMSAWLKYHAIGWQPGGLTTSELASDPSHESFTPLNSMMFPDGDMNSSSHAR